LKRKERELLDRAQKLRDIITDLQQIDEHANGAAAKS
jgi:hypothetical protein